MRLPPALQTRRHDTELSQMSLRECPARRRSGGGARRLDGDGGARMGLSKGLALSASVVARATASHQFPSPPAPTTPSLTPTSARAIIGVAGRDRPIP